MAEYTVSAVRENTCSRQLTSSSSQLAPTPASQASLSSLQIIFYTKWEGMIHALWLWMIHVIKYGQSVLLDLLFPNYRL